MGLYPGDSVKNVRGCGLYYEIDSSIGSGYYWVYPFKDLYAVSIYDVKFKYDMSIKFKEPSFIHFGNCSGSCVQAMFKCDAKEDNNLIGYVGGGDEYIETIQQHKRFQSIGVSLLPKFYENILKGSFSSNPAELVNVCSKLNGNFNIPEVITALKQISLFKAPSDIIPIYYQGKIFEIISLVMQWNLDNSKFQVKFSKVDIEALKEVENYINNNYKNQISLDMLSKISCMSRSKLTTVFKKNYGVTMTEYMHSLRIKEAKEMLIRSDVEIKKIAMELGYKLHGSFSELFKRETGFTPKQFRNKASGNK